jgi:hypothetical protein
MLLGRKNHTVGDDRRWVINYSDFLDKGIILTAATATSDSTTGTVGSVTLSDDRKRVYFYTHGGTLNETFTISLQATTSDSQTINDTAEFFVVAA